MSDFELILDNLVKNRRVFEKIEREPRKDNKSEDRPDGEKYPEEDIVSDEFPFTSMELQILVFFEDFEGSGEFFEGRIKTLCGLQELLLC